MKDDPTNPSHYRAGGMEAIDVVEAFGLGFNLGNALKYLLRCGRKGTPADALTDLKKCRWLLDREISSRSPSHTTKRRRQGVGT